jgi:phosphoribosylglycinamide formyltransferase 1
MSQNLIIFASGSGSNAQAIIDFFRNDPEVKIRLIACNKPQAGVLNIASHEGIPTLIIEKERFFRGNGYINELKALDPSLIILAGFLWKLPTALVQAFPGKIINIHPALLPKYGGKGMYGHFVHEAVKASGDLQTGITIHQVDEHYDNGTFLFQAVTDIEPDDSPETIAKKVLQLEHRHFPRIIQDLLRQNSPNNG